MAPGLMLVDDHVAIAQALASAFRSSGFDPVEALPRDAHDVDGVLAAARHLSPTVALVDLNLGAERSGLSLIGPLVGAGVRVVAFTARDDDLAMAECVEAGPRASSTRASSSRRSPSTSGEWPAARRRLQPRDDRSCSSSCAADASRATKRLARFRDLAPRERQVLADLLEGRSATDIAMDRALAVKTVRHQIEAIRSKLHVRSQLAAVALAREVGWSPD
jgi:DNA-binding NarL/FixJ family response regulator